MEKFNKTHENLKYSNNNKLPKMILNPNLSPLNNKLKNLNLKSHNKFPLYFRNKDYIISKDKTLANNNYNFNKNQFVLSYGSTKKNFSSQYPTQIKNEIIKIFATTYFKNKNPKNIIKKLDNTIKKNHNSKTQSNSQKTKKFQFLKKLIDHSNNNNLDDIDCILESPYRGVEKIGNSLSKTISREKNKNIYRPIFINDNYKGYFCIKNLSKAKSSLSILDKSSNDNKNIKKIKIDKYNEIKKNKEIDNPLKGLSILSGVSCSKLRKAIDYSLNHQINHFGSIIKKKFNIKINDNKNNDKNINTNGNNYKKLNFENKNLNKNKCIYSMITIKSKNFSNSQLIKKNSINLDNETSFDNVMGNNFFKDKKYKKKFYIKKRYNYYSPITSREKDLFKNITIKDKMEAFYE